MAIHATSIIGAAASGYSLGPLNGCIHPEWCLVSWPAQNALSPVGISYLLFAPADIAEDLPHKLCATGQHPCKVACPGHPPQLPEQAAVEISYHFISYLRQHVMDDFMLPPNGLDCC